MSDEQKTDIEIVEEVWNRICELRREGNQGDAELRATNNAQIADLMAQIAPITGGQLPNMWLRRHKRNQAGDSGEGT